MDMLGSTVASVVRIADIGAPSHVSAVGQTIRDGTMSQVEIDLIRSADGILQNDVVGAGGATIRAAIPRGDDRPLGQPPSGNDRNR